MSMIGRFSRSIVARSAAVRSTRTFTTLKGNPSGELTVDTMTDADGIIVVQLDGESVWVPDVARSIEWVLSTPTELHLFNETPVIKETTE